MKENNDKSCAAAIQYVNRGLLWSLISGLQLWKLQSSVSVFVNSNINFSGYSIKQHRLTRYSPVGWMDKFEIFKSAWYSNANTNISAQGSLHHVHTMLPWFSSTNQMCLRDGGCVISVVKLWCNSFVFFCNLQHGCVTDHMVVYIHKEMEVCRDVAL